MGQKCVLSLRTNKKTDKRHSADKSIRQTLFKFDDSVTARNIGVYMILKRETGEQQQLRRFQILRLFYQHKVSIYL